MTSSMSLGGVLSGIDYNTLIKGMMAREYSTYNRAATQKADYQSKDKAVGDIQKIVTDLQGHLDNLRDGDYLRSVYASTSDDSIVSASAQSGTPEGSHSIIVNQLATAHRMVHDAGMTYEASKVGTGGSISTADNDNTNTSASATWFTTSANGATYTLDFGDETDITSITLAASTDYSLDDVAALINERSQAVAEYDAAQVVDIGGGNFQLQLTAKYKGDSAELTATLTSGDAVAELENDQWTKTDGTDVATGAFSYTYNGVTRTLATTADTTLTDLVDIINDDASNPGVSASLIKHDGTYHLVLAGRDTGADYTVTINDASTTINGFDTADFVQAQTAVDAEYRVDGYPAGDWMTSSSNTLTEVLPGVTMTLGDTGTASITVGRKESELKNNVQNLVNIYNALANKVDQYTGYDEATGDGGILQGDSTMRLMLSTIREYFTTNLTGFDTSSDTYNRAYGIGIEIDREGVMSLNEEVFDEAIENNYDDVINFLSAAGRGVTDSNYFQFNSSLSNTEAGTYEVKVNYDGSGKVIAAWIRNEGEGDADWRVADYTDNVVTGLTGNPEQGLSITVTWDGSSSTATSQVRLQEGLAGILYDVTETMLDETNGTFSVRLEQYEQAIDRLDDKMESLLDRLESKQKLYEAKFARMEAAMAQMQNIQGQVSSLLASVASMESAKASSGSSS